MTEIWNDPRYSARERAADLLARMSREEKIHQLGSFWQRDDAEPAPAPDVESHDVAPMEGEFAKRRLSWEDSIAHGLGQLTRVFGADPVGVADGVEKLVAMQKDVQSRTAFGIPALPHEECLTGFTTLGATVYPAAIAWGATWRPELVEEMAAAIGHDLRAVGIYQGLSPLLDVVRDYRWGRVEETCGEDPYLVGTIGTAYIRGLQKAGVVATPKHFVGYPAARAGRNHAPVPMGPRELEEYMLPPFEMAVREGGAMSIMNSYSDIDSVPAASSTHLLTEVLRERWGFEGTVVSDYWSISFLNSMHRVAPTLTHAAALAVRAGLDVELPELGAYAHIGEAIDKGLLTEEELDRGRFPGPRTKGASGPPRSRMEPGSGGESAARSGFCAQPRHRPALGRRIRGAPQKRGDSAAAPHRAGDRDRPLVERSASVYGVLFVPQSRAVAFRGPRHGHPDQGA